MTSLRFNRKLEARRGVAIDVPDGRIQVHLHRVRLKAFRISATCASHNANVIAKTAA